MKECLFLLFLIPHCSSFFFPPSGNCGCSCPPVAPVVCTPPVCPTQPVCQQQTQNYALPSTGWVSGVPAPASSSYPSYPSYSVDTSNYMVTNTYAQPSNTGYTQSAVIPPSPVYAPIIIPQPSVSYIETSPAQSTQYGNSYTGGIEYQQRVDIPVSAYKEETAVEVAQPGSSPAPAPPASYSTLIPSYTEAPYQNRVPASSYDDTEPPALPPLPDQAVSYKTDEALQSMPPPGYQSGYQSATAIPPPQNLYDQQTGLNSGVNYGPEPPHKGKVSTEGYGSANSKRYIVMKKLKNARTMGARIPRTNATCNSKQLSNVMNRAMVDDVSVSKRMVLRATELAFEGARYDVFCATGEFSYSIHSRKYCEVTKNEITCFAFR